uniref:ATP-dependent RNA helicase n=1 Tax=Globodera rostochiensis TaxID=31243 RepID=A0A914H5Q0_GLORO
MAETELAQTDHLSSKRPGNTMDVVSLTEASSSTWNATGLSATILEALDTLNFPFPTPIQSAVIPPAVKLRKDIIGAAETGSGKTLAFAIPILEQWLESGNGIADNEHSQMEDLLFALIISPTRELAVQIKDVFKAFSAKIGPRTLKVVAIVGGMSEQKQHRLLKSRPDVIVATPGRLWALRQTGAEYLADLSALRILVVDEIDRMLEQGHFEELRHIVQDIHRAKKEQKIRKSVGSDELKSAVNVSRPPLQTLIFSATLTFTHHIPLRRGEKAPQSSMDPQQKVRRIAHSMCMRKGSAHLSVVDLTPPQKTPQTLIECRMNCGDLLQKDSNLLYVLKRYGGRTLEIGGREDVVAAWTDEGEGTAEERGQIQRVGRCRPTTEGYIHRSGRTARASNAGLSVLFVDPLDLHHYLKICRNLNKEEDLQLLAMDAPKLMESCRSLVQLATEAESLEHTLKKRKSRDQWFERIAREADLVWDEGETAMKRKMGRNDADEGPSNEELMQRRKRAIEKTLKGIVTSRGQQQQHVREGTGDGAEGGEKMGRETESVKRVKLEKGLKKWVKRARMDRQ